MKGIIVVLLAIAAYFMYSNLEYLDQRIISLSLREVKDWWFAANPLFQYLSIGIVSAFVFKVRTTMVKEDHRAGMFYLHIIAWPLVLLLIPIAKFLHQKSKYGKG